MSTHARIFEEYTRFDIERVVLKLHPAPPMNKIQFCAVVALILN
jgi:hypothetical protein